MTSPREAAYVSSSDQFPPSISPPPYSAMVNAGYLPSLDRSQPFKTFPPVQDVVELVEVDEPGQQFGRLVDFLLEAGIFSSEQILLCPEDMLCVIGNMGLAQARILRNYAKHMVLPVLGLQGNYEEPDLTIYQLGIKKTNQTTTYKKEEEILGEGSGTQQHDNCESSGMEDDYHMDGSDGLDDSEKDNCVSYPLWRGRSLSV